MDKRYRELSRAIKPYGYKLKVESRHAKVYHPATGHTLTCSGSPRNVGNWIKNVVNDIRRYRDE